MTKKGTIAVTGATGKLGRLVIDDLLAGGVEPGNIVAFARDINKGAELMEKGVVVKNADYTKPDTLAAALEGVEKLLLISSNEVGQRFAQHKNIVEAAENAGVMLIVYTSLLNADSSQMALAAEHIATEELIKESGIPYVLLRNGWYFENYTENLKPVFDHGAIAGSAQDGKVSAATRGDYAAAATVVLTSAGHENKTYELGGDTAFTLAELAAEVGRQSGREISYNDLPAEEYAKILVSAGLPQTYADVLADSDLGIVRGELYTDSKDLTNLIGRPTTSLAGAVSKVTDIKTAGRAA